LSWFSKKIKRMGMPELSDPEGFLVSLWEF